MLHREAFIFLSSPGSVTPCHMDPEHHILLQIRGEKKMTVFPAGDEELVPAVQSVACHAAGHRNPDWRDGCRPGDPAVTLLPGDVTAVTVKGPHFVETGPADRCRLAVTRR